MGRRKKKKKYNKPEATVMGSIIDMPLEDFKKELVKQKVNVGVANNLRLHLIGEYERCKSMVQDLQSAILAGTLKEDDPEVQKSYVGLHVQMQKIEDKVCYLVEYTNQLSTGLESTFDTQKH